MFRTYTADAPNVRPANKARPTKQNSFFSGTKVEVLTTPDFDARKPNDVRIKQFSREGVTAIIMFYAPWCYYCSELKSEWIKLADRVESMDLARQVRVCAVDCDAQPAVNAMFGIEGYPTIACVSAEGKITRYEGSRTLTALEDWARQVAGGSDGDEKQEAMASPAGTEQATPAMTGTMFGQQTRVTNLTEANYDFKKKRFVGIATFPVAVLYYAPWCRFCKDMKDEWVKLAARAPSLGVTVAALDCTRFTNVSTLMGVDGFPFIVLYKSASFSDTAVYVGPRRVDAFVRFIETHSWRGNNEAVSEVMTNNNNNNNNNNNGSDGDMINVKYARYVNAYDTQKVVQAASRSEQGDSKGTLVMFYLKRCTAATYDRERLLPAAAYKFSKYLRVGMIDIDENRELAERLCVDASPCYVLFLKGQTYKYVGARNKKSLYTFLADRLNGTLGSKTYIRFNPDNVGVLPAPLVVGAAPADDLPVYV